jgi:riboflavin synthase
MFDGIVKGKYPVKKVDKRPGLLTYAVAVDPPFLAELPVGGSVAVDGVCQTVVKIEPPLLYFEAIENTLKITSLKDLTLQQEVNLARSIRLGEEIGGHLLSGHIIGTATITHILQEKEERLLSLTCPPLWMKYFFSKGFIALDGVSLTISEVDKQEAKVSVALIPLTQQLTTLGTKGVGASVNVEIDSFTQITVDSVERLLLEKGSI